jgi:hypothetical protein
MFVPLGLVLIIIGLVCWLPYLVFTGGEWISDKISEFEAWCFKESHEASGMYYQGSGIWTNRKP